MALATKPELPFIQNHPGVMCLRPLSKCGRIAARYDKVDMMTYDPTKALNAVVEPT